MKREPLGISYDTTRIGQHQYLALGNGSLLPLARSRCCGEPNRPEQQRERVALRRVLLGLAGW